MELTAIMKGAIFVFSLHYSIDVLGRNMTTRVVIITMFSILMWSFFLSQFDERFRFVLVSSVGFNDELYGWRGAFLHKNHLASFCIIAIFVALCFLLSGKEILFSALCILLSCFLLWQSQGKSAQLLTVGLGLLLLAFYVTDRLLKMPLPLSIGISAGLILMVGFGLVALGELDWTFTGRTRIWRAYFELGMQRPLFGHGAGYDLTSDEVFWFLRQYAGGMTSAHNSYLAVFFVAGLAGLTLFLGWIVAAVLEALGGGGNRTVNAALLALIVSAILHGFFEARFSPHIGGSFPALAIMVGLALKTRSRPGPLAPVRRALGHGRLPPAHSPPVQPHPSIPEPWRGRRDLPSLESDAPGHTG